MQLRSAEEGVAQASFRSGANKPQHEPARAASSPTPRQHRGRRTDWRPCPAVTFTFIRPGTGAPHHGRCWLSAIQSYHCKRRWTKERWETHVTHCTLLSPLCLPAQHQHKGRGPQPGAESGLWCQPPDAGVELLVPSAQARWITTLPNTLRSSLTS